MQATSPLGDDDLARLQSLLDTLPAPLQPMDVSALDGYLCGVLLQPRAVPSGRWWPYVIDLEGHPAPASSALDEVQALVQRRHAELNAAQRMEGALLRREQHLDVFDLDEVSCHS